MKSSNFDNYELFYEEIPHSEYYKDIEIQDEAENHGYDQVQGLSEDQVSELARDLRDSIKKEKRDRKKQTDETTLFSNTETA
jgi:hypothetical protein